MQNDWWPGACYGDAGAAARGGGPERHASAVEAGRDVQGAAWTKGCAARAPGAEPLVTRPQTVPGHGQQNLVFLKGLTK